MRKKERKEERGNLCDSSSYQGTNHDDFGKLC